MYLEVSLLGLVPQVDPVYLSSWISKAPDIKPKASDPKVWFTSMRSLAEVLSDENRALLKIIWYTKPTSIAMLAEQPHRKPSNLSRTLKTMANYGFVEMRPVNARQVQPTARAVDFRITANAS
jgi:predicted transcriptional regulator